MATMNRTHQAMHARPFQPFVDHPVTGKSFRVKPPDFVAVANRREMVFVGDDEGIHNIALPLIVHVEIPSAEGQPRPPRQRGVRWPSSSKSLWKAARAAFILGPDNGINPRAKGLRPWPPRSTRTTWAAR